MMIDDIQEILREQKQIIDYGINCLARVDFCINRILSYYPDTADSQGPPYMLVSQPEIPERLEDLCNAQASAYSCLFDNSRQRSSESKHLYNKRISRVTAFRVVCGNIDVPELRNKGVRNALAHLDERLLKEILKPSQSGWIQDVALSHKDAFQRVDEARYIRVYIFRDDELHLLGEKFKLLPLRAEIDGVFKAIGVEIDTSERSR